MRPTIAVLATVILSVAFLVLAALALTLLTYSWGESIFGEAYGNVIKTGFVWLVSPGIGTYCGMKVARKYFPDVEVKTIFIAIVCIVITYAVIMEGFSILLYVNENPHSPSIIEMLVLLGQSASFIVGAKIYESDEGS